MKKLFIFLLVLVFIVVLTNSENISSSGSAEQGNPTERVITDMAGRQVTIPGKVEKAFSVNTVASLIIYTLSPEKLLGWNYTMPDENKKYLVKDVQELKDLGSMYGNKATTNTEELLSMHPDVLFLMDTISETVIAKANEFEQTLRIPVVVLDSKLEALSETYKLAGEVLNKEQRAEQLSNYCSTTISEIKEITSKIPEDQKIKIYYAYGKDGLLTSPQKTKTVELIDYAGGINCAQVKSEKGVSRYTVALEQVMLWDPDVILASMGGHQSDLAKKILKDSNWRTITAIKTKKVYEVPLVPFNWFENPPSSNRIIGLKWLLAEFYPHLINYDIRSEIKEFYNLFYLYDLTDDEIDSILGL